VNLMVMLVSSNGQDLSLEFSVRDTGIGIPAADKERMMSSHISSRNTESRHLRRIAMRAGDHYGD
jgi:signal transduction histidine kinase